MSDPVDDARAAEITRLRAEIETWQNLVDNSLYSLSQAGTPADMVAFDEFVNGVYQKISEARARLERAESAQRESEGGQTSLSTSVSLKRYAHGKYFLFAKGDPAYADAAAQAFSLSVHLSVTLDRDRFRAEMRQRGIPDPEIETLLVTCEIRDETFSTPRAES